jgi:LAO/AO transport system kinase
LLKPNLKLKSINIQQLEEGIKSGDRTALSRAITLAESTLPEHQFLAQELIHKLMPLTGNSKRIAITGVPGVGKSTFIESFGKLLTAKNLKVAVLAVDPSSYFSKGSILGDKTRMEELAKNPNAYIRPSATGGFLGGIASRTFESVLLCEAAGFEIILIETVGVGQSETLVNEITDMFLFLQIPGAGDDLQGIKRGIMEMADVIFVNKVDNFGLEKSKDVKVTLTRSLQFLPQKASGWKRKILLGSGLTAKGLEEVWATVNDYFSTVEKNGFLQENRNRQVQLRVEEYIKELILLKLKDKKINIESDLGSSPFQIAQKWLKDNEL